MFVFTFWIFCVKRSIDEIGLIANTLICMLYVHTHTYKYYSIFISKMCYNYIDILISYYFVINYIICDPNVLYFVMHVTFWCYLPL